MTDESLPAEQPEQPQQAELPEPPVQAELPEQPEQSEQAERDELTEQSVEAAHAPVRRRLVLGALGVAFVLSAVGVGTVVGLGMRSPAPAPAKVTAAAQAHKPTFGAHSDGDHYGSLSDLLLPMPAGYQYGPDDLGLGDDSVLTPDQYASMFTKTFSFLSSTERNQLKTELDLDHILGYGLRTYSDGSAAVIELTLLQENQHSAKGEAQALKYLNDHTDVYRAGPSVPGHPEAHCYLLPAVPGDTLDTMHCDAAVGDLLVSLHEDGTAPLDQQGAAVLLEAQLNRLAIPAAQI